MDGLIIIFAFIIFASWYHKTIYDHKVTTTANIEEGYKIFLITMDKQSNFYHQLHQGSSDMSEMLGVNLIWTAPEQRGVEEQVKLVNDAVRQGANAILLAAIDPVRLTGAVEDAKAKSVSIIYVDAPANEEGIVTLATENYSAGRIAGEEMLSKLKANGIKNGSIGIIGVTPETITTEARERGFRDVIAQNESFTLLDTKYAEGISISLAEQVAVSYLEANNDLVGIFGTSESTTVGMGMAIQKSDKKVIGIGFDINETIESFIQSNSIEAVLVQNPYTMGYLGIAEAIAALKGYDTGPSFINTGVTVIDQYTLQRVK